MTTLTLPWFEDEDSRDLRRWAIAAAVVLGVHIGGVGLYAFLHQPEEIGDDTSPITIDLTPSDDTVDQPEVAPVPESQPKTVEQPRRRLPTCRKRSWSRRSRRHPSRSRR